MSTITKLSGNDFDRMVLRGAFVDIEPKKVELIYGEIRFMNPAGPVHDGQIEYLTNCPMRIRLVKKYPFECSPASIVATTVLNQTLYGHAECPPNAYVRRMRICYY
jgi:hypothetical protein